MNANEIRTVNRRLMIFLKHHEIIQLSSIKFNEMADLFIDYNNLVKPENVSYRAFMHQLYHEGKLPLIEGYSVSVTKPQKKETYKDQLKDNRWHMLRLRAIRRDEGRCQMCDTDKDLVVHHKRYINGKKAWEYPLNLLITVCKRCHNKHHGKKHKK